MGINRAAPAQPAPVLRRCVRVLEFCRAQGGLGMVTVEAFGMDSSGWPVPTRPRVVAFHPARAFTARFYRQRGGCCCRASLGSGLLRPAAASAVSSSVPPPRPTPATTIFNGIPFHFDHLGAGVDPSSITDFNGFAGAADVRGTGTARNPDGSVETLLFDTNMRFMQGTYAGLDGGVHEATFGFV